VPASNPLYLNDLMFETPVLDLRLSGNLEGPRGGPTSWQRCMHLRGLDAVLDAQIVVNWFIWRSRI